MGTFLLNRAALSIFREPQVIGVVGAAGHDDNLDIPSHESDEALAHSTIKHYLCLENRFGLLTTSKKLTRGLCVVWLPGVPRLNAEKFFRGIFWINEAPSREILGSSMGSYVAELAFTF